MKILSHLGTSMQTGHFTLSSSLSTRTLRDSFFDARLSFAISSSLLLSFSALFSLSNSTLLLPAVHPLQRTPGSSSLLQSLLHKVLAVAVAVILPLRMISTMSLSWGVAQALKHLDAYSFRLAGHSSAPGVAEQVCCL